MGISLNFEPFTLSRVTAAFSGFSTLEKILIRPESQLREGEQELTPAPISHLGSG
jgi:hypothetical protein